MIQLEHVDSEQTFLPQPLHHHLWYSDGWPFPPSHTVLMAQTGLYSLELFCVSSRRSEVDSEGFYTQE